MYIITESRFLKAANEYYGTEALLMADIPLPESAEQLLYLINFCNNYTEKNISLDDVFEMSCKHFGVDKKAIRSKNRKRSITTTRHMIQAGISNIFTSFTLREIGVMTGYRDHTTVIHAKHKISNLCATEPETKSKYEKFISLLIMLANGKKAA